MVTAEKDMEEVMQLVENEGRHKKMTSILERA